jgi:choline dehydrogenase-like flavoprotein
MGVDLCRVTHPEPNDPRPSALIIGSGFGGAMAAHVLVHAGWRVTMVERGGWVDRGPGNWEPEAVGNLGPHYTADHLYADMRHGRPRDVGGYHCVGGPSVFYGGVSLRFREADFEPVAEIDGESAAAWPYRYEDLEPWYTRAETLLGVAGQEDEDPTEPRHGAPYLHPPLPLAPISARIARAASSLGLRPFRLPLALNTAVVPGRATCIACATCDGYACAIEAKNDLATVVLGPLLARGLDLQSDTVVTRLHHDGRRVTSASGTDLQSGEPATFAASQVILAAGALATPHLLLESGLDRLGPGGDAVGRYLTRHKNEIVLGFFASPPDPDRRFHKQLGIHDFYFGAPDGRGPAARLGGLQQLPTPPVALARDGLPWLLKPLAPLVRHLTGLLLIAEDQPRRDNRVTLGTTTDREGMRRLEIHHQYSARDLAAAAVLRRAARRILRRTGALVCYTHVIDTWSHALGTARMGVDPATSVLDGDCRVRGIDNLLVTDGSALPRAAGVNPSLTIAANALRAASRLVERVGTPGLAARSRHG